MLKNLLFAFFFVLVLLVVSPVKASADDGSTLRQAYKPYTVSSTGWMRARVDNFAAVAQKRLVCVEAFNTVNNAKTHLGCLWVDLAPTNTGGMWASEFDVPTTMLSSGNYNVVYTYQDGEGMWHRIKSINLEMQDGMYTR